MADLDDLLGDGGIGAAADSLIDAADDLLGGGGAGASTANFSTAAFDDDLLFGGGSSTGGGGAGIAGLDDDADFGGGKASKAATGAAAADMPPVTTRKRSKPISIPVLENVSPALNSFVSSATFFARFVSIIDRDDKRTRRVLTVTDSTIYVMTPEVTVERSVSVSSVIGLITRNVEVSKFFGKETETIVLIQIEGEKDIYFALTKDDHNGNTSSMLDIIQVLTSICMAHGHALPVSVLKDGESITEMVKFSVGDDAIRRQLTEALAFRTELINEITRLTKHDGQLEVAITSIKNSSAGQAAADLTSDMNKISATIAHFREKNAQLEVAKTAAQQRLAELNKALAEEEDARAREVQSTVEAAAQEQLMRQLAEYEIMKAAHKREMDKIGALTSFLEGRVNNRGAGIFTTTGALSQRIDSLEDDYAWLTERLAERSDEHAARIKALAEGKKRVAQGKELLETLRGELEIIKATPLTAALPSHIVMSELPPIAPVKPVATVAAKEATSPAMAAKHADPVAASQPQPQPQPAAVAAARPPINLDDDEDL